MEKIEKINQAGTQSELSKNRNPAIEKGLIKSVCLNCGRQYKKQTEICQKCLFKTKSI